MADVVVIVGVVLFFVVAVLFIRACDWIIGPDARTDAEEAAR